MKTVINIKGTHCESCKKLLESVCKEVKGVTACTVDYKTGKTEIEHDSKFDLNELKKEIKSLGLYKI